jgi:hypothetical protein
MEQSEKDPISIDRKFLDALVALEFESLEIILADDFTLIDLSGAVVTKAAFLGNLRAGDLNFEAIQPDDISVRVYDSTTLVTGRTVMRGTYKGAPFAFSSRYTHTYVNKFGHWYMVAAQGTPIAA